MGLGSKFQLPSSKTLAVAFEPHFCHKYIKNAQKSSFLIIFFLKNIFFSKPKKMLLPSHEADLNPKLEVDIRKTAACSLWTDKHQTNKHTNSDRSLWRKFKTKEIVGKAKTKGYIYLFKIVLEKGHAPHYVHMVQYKNSLHFKSSTDKIPFTCY